MTRIPILDCVPGTITLRPQQVEALLFIEKNYDEAKFLCIGMPVGAGKSWVVTTFNNWLEKNNLGRSADVTPTKLLQDQYTKDFDWIPDLKGQDSYFCALTGGKATCAEYKRNNPQGRLCGGPEQCCYMAAKSDTEASNTAIYNFHSYYYNRASEHKSHLIIDEGHNTRQFLEDLYTINLWSCELGFDESYPVNPQSVIALLENAFSRAKMELSEAIAHKVNKSIIDDLEEFIRRVESVTAGLRLFGEDILIVTKNETYNKKRWLKRDMSAFKGKEQYVIRIKPLRINKIAESSLWVEDIRKVLFLSATIGPNDMEELGIRSEDVRILQTSSPIPAEQRKVIVWPVASMNYNNQKESLPKIVAAIENIASKNANTKGLIHCTYSLARELKNYLKSDRYLFHDNSNKNEVYHQFRAAKEPKILVASGMAEGIDLPDDLARWQVVTKVMYPSLADDVWAWKATNNQKAYLWETVKTIIQQSGRICRGPQDRGFTYIIDSEFKKLWDRTKKLNFWPAWFCEALVWVDAKEK